MLFAQPLHELDQKGLWQLFSFAESLVQVRHHARGLKRGEFEKLVREFVSFIAPGACAGDRDRKATQVFDERETQRDCNGPQFADRKWGDNLIRSDESLQRVGVETRVSMRDQFEGDCIDARVAL